MIQTTKQQIWHDEKGVSVPLNRITPVEKLMERSSSMLLRRSQSISKELAELKKTMRETCREVFEKFMADKGGNPDSKGNFVWFNFDRSIKIEVDIKDRVTFDDLTIRVAQDKLNLFLAEAVDSKFDYVKDMITDAFATSRGRMDAKKVMSLTRYRDRIKHPLFDEACSMIEQSIRRPDQKTYFRISIKDEDGAYQVIELNFSNI